MHRAKKKDLLAMKVLYNLFVQDMITLSYRMTQNRADAEDIVQEAFITSFQKLNSLKEPAHYKAWLKRIVINSSLQHIKKRVNFSEIEHLKDQAEEAVTSNWYQNIPFHTIKAAINDLPDGCRQIFTLFLMENYKHREIAELLNISVSTSKSQYRYALKLLRQALKQWVD